MLISEYIINIVNILTGGNIILIGGNMKKSLYACGSVDYIRNYWDSCCNLDSDINCKISKSSNCNDIERKL